MRLGIGSGSSQKGIATSALWKIIYESSMERYKNKMRSEVSIYRENMGFENVEEKRGTERDFPFQWIPMGDGGWGSIGPWRVSTD